MESSLSSDLLAFHHVISRAMAVSLERAREYGRKGFPDAAVRRGYLDYVTCLVTLTRAHHDTEDELVFPAFDARMPTVPFDILDAQHGRLLPLLDAVAASVEAGAAGRPGAEWLPQLADSLESLGELWTEHIGVEEKHLTAEAISRAFSAAEQEELSRKASEHGQKLAQPAPLLLPFVLFNLDPAERAVLAAKLPPPLVKQLIPIDWKEAWSPMKPFLLS